MSAIVAALASVEFWFGVAAGIALDEAAKKALKARIFNNSCTCDDHCCENSADE